jgi:hypothetical protein
MAKSRRNFLKTAAEARVIDRPGSDFMLDVFKSIGFD